MTLPCLCKTICDGKHSCEQSLVHLFTVVLCIHIVMSESTGTTGIPGTHRVSEMPETSEAPEMPETSEMPEMSETSETSETRNYQLPLVRGHKNKLY